MRISDWSSDVCSSDLHLPATVAVAPPQLAPFQLLQPPFRSWGVAGQADQKLAHVPLPQAKMHAEPQEPERPDRLGMVHRVGALIRHQPDDFAGNLDRKSVE